MKFIKRKVALGVGIESTRGTAVNATYTIPFTDINFDDKVDKARQMGSMGSIAGDSHQAIVAAIRSEGSIESEIYAQSFPLIMKATLGTLSSAAQGAAYKHTLAVAENNQHPTMTIHIADPNGAMKFRSCMVDTFDMEVSQSDIVKYTIGVKGKASSGSTFTKSLIDDYKFVGRDLDFRIADDTAGLATASPLSLKTLKLSINKNVDFDYALGTLEPEDIFNKQVTVKGEITLNYTDKVFKEYMLDGAYKAVGIKLEDKRSDLGGGVYPTFYISFPRVDFTEWETSGKLDEIVGQKITFNVLFDVTTGKIISDCYVINSIASY